MKLYIKSICLFTILVLQLKCSSSNEGEETGPTPAPPTSPAATNEVDFWLTKGDESIKLQKQSVTLEFGTKPNIYPTIEIRDSEAFQNVDGFGFTLTGGSAQVINGLTDQAKNTLLQELFGSGNNAIGINYLRISIGASDLNPSPFTYNDMPTGETDPDLANFSLEPDRDGVIALLKEILAIDPTIKIMGSPWSAPVWMKDNGSFIGGRLLPEHYGTYADYFVKYIQQMKEEGILIDAITIQNEPLHGGNNPSMLMQATEQADFIKNHLGPAFANANITTKIIAWDHNCDNPQYPITVLNDPGANPFVDGSAFHLYNGDISALSIVHDAHPDKNLYFTEQYTSSTSDFQGDLKWHLKNVIIGSMRNWSRNALEWNLANDETFGPHTEGGCTVCKGALTIDSNGMITRNVGYYVVAHASKFVPTGSVRIGSDLEGSLQNVAFRTPEGKKVLIVENDGDKNELFNIKFNGEWVTAAMDAGSVATFIWD